MGGWTCKLHYVDCFLFDISFIYMTSARCCELQLDTKLDEFGSRNVFNLQALDGFVCSSEAGGGDHSQDSL